MFQRLFGKPAVKISKTTVGDHRDHWKAIYGAHLDDESLVETGLREIELAEVIEQSRLLGMKRIQRDYGRLSFRGLLQFDEIVTFYPVLLTRRSLPVTVKEIIEWKHVGCAEAQIRGQGRDTFGLNFFAADYLDQAKQYQAGGSLSVALSGIGYEIQEVTEMPEHFSDQFTCYMPFDGRPECMDYKFVGQILGVEDLCVGEETCHILDVRLISDDDPHFFNLELLVNARHISAPLTIGTRIFGYFWLQGYFSTPDVDVLPVEKEIEPQQPVQSERPQRRW